MAELCFQEARLKTLKQRLEVPFDGSCLEHQVCLILVFVSNSLLRVLSLLLEPLYECYLFQFRSLFEVYIKRQNICINDKI